MLPELLRNFGWTLYSNTAESVIYRKGSDEVIVRNWNDQYLDISLPIAGIMYRTTVKNTPGTIEAYLHMHLSYQN